MKYKSRGLRKRGDSSWQARISHVDPLTGEQVTSYHTIKATSERQAKKKRDELLYRLESGGLAMGLDMTIKQFMESFLEYKVSSKTIEPSTIRGYRCETKMMCKYIGSERISDLTVPAINRWMAKMSEDGYAPKSISKCFRLLKQALNYAIAQDLLTKNPCNLHDLCHTFATFMIGSGADVRTVADYLGHANPSMTLDIYADVDPEAKQQAVKYIEDAFDDPYSVFQRDVEQRRCELEEPRREFDPGRIASLSPESIPFSIEELEEMIAVLKKAS